MIGETRGSALLKGFRGGTIADMRALKKCLVNVSQLLCEHFEIQMLDINALIVYREDCGRETAFK